MYVPSTKKSSYSPVNGRSVPLSTMTRASAGVSWFMVAIFRSSESPEALRLRVDVGVHPEVQVLAVDLEAGLLVAARRGHHQRLPGGTRCGRLDRETDHERVTLPRNRQVVRHSVSLLVACVNRFPVVLPIVPDRNLLRSSAVAAAVTLRLSRSIGRRSPPIHSSQIHSGTTSRVRGIR